MASLLTKTGNGLHWDMLEVCKLAFSCWIDDVHACSAHWVIHSCLCQVKKRVSIPDGAVELITTFRNLVSNMSTLFSQYAGASVETMLDVDKTVALIAEVEPSVKIPRRCQMLLAKARAIDSLQFERYKDFAEAICLSTSASLGWSQDEIRGGQWLASPSSRCSISLGSHER